MTLTPYFQFGNITGVESANFPLSRGVSPSVCTISILPGVQLDRNPKTMVFGDGVRSVSFDDCVIVDCSPQIDASGFQTLTVSIHDRRWRWRFGQVSGVYNVRRSGKLDEATKKTPRQLAELCFKAMAERRYDLSRMPNDALPYTSWDIDRPDAALDRLCQSVNAHVVLRADGVAAIYPDGFGANLPAIPSSSSSEAFEFGVTPGRVSISTAPLICEFDFNLEPVGLDVDGSVVPIDALSYKPRLRFGWYDAVDPYEFPGLPDKVRKLAVLSVFRWYRIVPPKTVVLAGGQKVNPVSIRQFLPLLENQLAYAPLTVEQKAKNTKDRILDTDRERLPRQVFGKFYDEGGAGKENVAAFRSNTIAEPELIYSKAFSVDNDIGVLKFSDPVFQYNAAAMHGGGKAAANVPSLLNAQIRLRCGTNFRDDNGSAYRFSKSVAIPGGIDPAVIAWESRDDITPEVRFDQATQKSVNNYKEVEDRLKYYLTYAQQRYTPKTPASGSYPWVVPFSPDGRIAQVVYEIDGQGFVGTSIYREIEGLLNITDYTERRIEVSRLATQQKLTRELNKQDSKEGKQ